MNNQGTGSAKAAKPPRIEAEGPTPRFCTLHGEEVNKYRQVRMVLNTHIGFPAKGKPAAIKDRKMVLAAVAEAG